MGISRQVGRKGHAIIVEYLVVLGATGIEKSHIGTRGAVQRIQVEDEI
jgi:hypothetical protein